MPRAIWKGHLSFGLVQMPVELFPAESRRELEFELLDRRDEQPIGYRKYNKTTGDEVPPGQVVKGFEVAPGQHVLLSDEDFARARVESLHTIDVAEFVEASAIAPLYFDRPYYVVPGKGGERPCRLLVATLQETGRVGIGRVVLRTRESVAAIYPYGDVLVLDTLRYGYELRDVADLELSKPHEKPTPKELSMAKRLVDEMSGSWRPSEFKDRYHDDLLEIIRTKARSGEKGLPPVSKAPPSRVGRALDLTTLLEQSLGRRRAVAPTRKVARAARRRSK